MDSLTTEMRRPTVGPFALPFYYGWVNLMVAALAMVGTLPGRTQGLGLITEPLLADLQMDRVVFARINLWATLVGALFCLGVGRAIDRFGSQVVLTVVAVALGTVVLWMSGVKGAVISRLADHAHAGVGAERPFSHQHYDSRPVVRASTQPGDGSLYDCAERGLYVGLPHRGRDGDQIRLAHGMDGRRPDAAAGPRASRLVPRAADARGVRPVRPTASAAVEERIADVTTGHTLWQALSTPAFWVFGLASAVYGLIASGIALFNESILAERGFDASTYHRSLVIVALTALVGNFLGGWLTSKWSMNRLLALAMGLLAGSLLALPHVRTQTHVVAYALVMGLAGGFVIVIFFSFWSRAFGRAHLGKIQGAAQALTVVASAVGPLLLAECVSRTGSYAAMFYLLTLIVVVLGFSAWFVTVPPASTIPTTAG